MKQKTDRVFGRLAIGILIGILVILLIGSIPFLWHEYKWSRIESFQDTANGMSRTEVDRKYGQPVREFRGFYSNEIDRQVHPDPSTCVYEVVGGEFFVGFEMQGESMVAFSSDFLPAGAVF